MLELLLPISDDDNNIYVANYLAGTVTKINAAGIAQVIASGLKKLPR